MLETQVASNAASDLSSSKAKLDFCPAVSTDTNSERRLPSERIRRWFYGLISKQNICSWGNLEGKKQLCTPNDLLFAFLVKS